jgi:STAS domain-containing protein
MISAVSTEQIGDVAVLQCRGRFVDQGAVTRFKAAVTGFLQLRVVVLDLSGVEMVDARGLGMLVFFAQLGLRQRHSGEACESFQTSARDARSHEVDICIAHLIGKRPRRDIL